MVVTEGAVSPGCPPPSCPLCQVASLQRKADPSRLFHYKARGSARADTKPASLPKKQSRVGGGGLPGAAKEGGSYVPWEEAELGSVPGTSQ